MSDSLPSFRPEFPILERSTYLVSNSLGAMPRGVPDRLTEHVDQWAELGVRAWAKGWWDMPISVGDETAPRNADRRRGTVDFDVPNSYGAAQALLANDVVADYDPNAGIRIGPHFYTTDEELERVVDTIDGILRGESWKPFEAKRGRVT